VSAEGLDRPGCGGHHLRIRITQGPSQPGQHAGMPPAAADRQGGEPLLQVAATPEAELMLQLSPFAIVAGRWRQGLPQPGRRRRPGGSGA